MRILLSSVAFACALTSLQAQNTLQISIGVRETGFAGSTVTTIGQNGGIVGGIEWVNKDAQTLVLDGTWQTFTFNFATDPIASFAGTTANSILEGTHGVLENLRVVNIGGITAPIVLLMDDVTDTPATLGPVVFGDFENLGATTPAMFREASFSGSTSANVMAGPTTQVYTDFPTGSDALRMDWQFVDGATTRWVRFTSYNLVNLGNPVVQFDDQSVLTFRLLGYFATQQNLGSGGPGMLSAEFCGSGLAAGMASTLHVGGAPANTFGGMLVMLPGLPDFPVLGGTVVSGTGYLFSQILIADANGQASVTLGGHPAMLNFVMRSLFVDTSLPQQFAFSDAFLASFGI